MRMFQSLILGLLLTQVSVACKSNAKISGTVKERELPADSDTVPAPTNTNPESETVTLPTAITGALLTCATIESNDKVEVRVACRYENANKVRVPLSAIASEQKFSYDSVLPAGITITLEAADANYEAYFVFSGASFATLNALIKTVRFEVELIGLTTGDPDKTIGGKGNVLAQAPVKRWVRDSKSDANGNGLCDTGESCIFVGNGLMWLRDTGASQNHMLSSQACNAATDTYDDWFTPDLNSLKMAFEKNIWELADPALLNLGDGDYYSSQGPVPAAGVEAALNNVYTYNLKTGNQVTHNLNDTLRSLCVKRVN
jgi:hypothetical protein